MFAGQFASYTYELITNLLAPTIVPSILAKSTNRISELIWTRVPEGDSIDRECPTAKWAALLVGNGVQSVSLTTGDVWDCDAAVCQVYTAALCYADTCGLSRRASIGLALPHPASANRHVEIASVQGRTCAYRRQAVLFHLWSFSFSFSFSYSYFFQSYISMFFLNYPFKSAIMWRIQTPHLVELMNIVSNYIFDCNNRDANSIRHSSWKHGNRGNYWFRPT